jgi:hypothetical protein
LSDLAGFRRFNDTVSAILRTRNRRTEERHADRLTCILVCAVSIGGAGLPRIFSCPRKEARIALKNSETAWSDADPTLTETRLGIEVAADFVLARKRADLVLARPSPWIRVVFELRLQSIIDSPDGLIAIDSRSLRAHEDAISVIEARRALEFRLADISDRVLVAIAVGRTSASRDGTDRTEVLAVQEFIERILERRASEFGP